MSRHVRRLVSQDKACLQVRSSHPIMCGGWLIRTIKLHPAAQHESPSRTSGGGHRTAAYSGRRVRLRCRLTTPAAGRGRQRGGAGGGPGACAATSYTAAVPVRTGADAAAPAEGQSRRTSREGSPIPDSDSRGLHAAGPVLTVSTYISGSLDCVVSRLRPGLLRRAGSV
jgi:hypothetical protein